MTEESPECRELFKIQNEELLHEPEYKEGFDNIPESVKDRMTQAEVEAFYADPEGESKWQKEHRARFVAHIKSCQRARCIQLCKTWEEEGLFDKL